MDAERKASIELDVLVSCWMKHFDESHDMEHIARVFRNACLIAESQEFADLFQINKDNSHKRNWTLLEFAVKLHDVLDHKYTHLHAVTEACLRESIKRFQELVDTEQVLFIINNISYSTQVKLGIPKHRLEVVNRIRNIVADADRIEALGKPGLERCRQYTKSILPDASEEKIVKRVVGHCHEKLLKLYGEKGFIVTEEGRKIAQPLHEEIVEFVKQQEPAKEGAQIDKATASDRTKQLLSSFKQFEGFPKSSDFIDKFLNETKREECPRWISVREVRVVNDRTKCWSCGNEEYTTSVSGCDEPEINVCEDSECNAAWTTRGSLVEWKREIDEWNDKKSL